MSDNKNQNRRKKSKSTKKKSSNAKTKTQKTRVTREYLDNEQEVLRLLERASLALVANGDDKEEKPPTDSLSQSVEFFCKENYKGQQQKTAETEIANGSSEAQTDEEDSLVSEEDEYEDALQNDLASSSTKMHLPTTRANPPIQDVSSFIQLEFSEALNKLPRVSGRVQFAGDLLYEPKSELSTSIVNALPVDQKLLPANTARLINRYYEERAGDVMHVTEVARTLSTEDCEKYTSDKKLYRTFCDHEFQGVFCEPTLGTVSIPTRKLIKLFIKELCFTEHAQLQPEHRLANMLTDYYQAYEERLRLRVCEKFQTTLQTERKIVSDLLKREAVAVHTQDMETKQQRANLLAEHLQAVQKQRQRLYQAEAVNKRLIQQILKNWKMLKMLRQEQGYQYTRVRLRIRMLDAEDAAEDASAARRAWMQRYETDLNENYREALETYYSAKRMWLQHRESNDTAELKRPKKPNLEKLAQAQRQKLIESIGQPDEPKIELIYDRLSDEKFQEVAPPAELQRNRKERSYFLKLYFDGQPVGMTRTYRLETDLCLNINEAIGIFLERRLPKDINVALFEKFKLPMVPTKIANIIVPLPLGSDVTDFQTQHISFSSHKQPLSGRLDLRFECDENIYPDDMIKVLFPPPKERTKIPKEILKGWQRQQLMEHQHLKNGVHSENESECDMDGFQKAKSPINFETCTFEEDLLKFCSMDELANNKRFKILFSRYQKQDARTRDLRFVPALEHELACEDLEEEDEAVIEAGNWINPIDFHKHEAKKYLKNFYDTIRNQCTRLSKVIDCSENLLLGDEPVTISSFFQALSSILSPRRPLYPARNNNTPSVQPQLNSGSATSSNNKFTINLNVVRATGIPVRSSCPNQDNDNRQRSSESSSLFMPQQTFKYSNVRPFVALSYRDKLCRTMTAEGSNPTWNEQLHLQLIGNMDESRDDIKISLFDEVIENHINDDATPRNIDSFQRIQTNWLGEYRIPISTLLSRTKIEGVFEFNIPKVLLGYQRPTFDSITPSTDTNIVIEQIPEIKETVHLWFYISIEPSFELPQRLSTACLECSELRDVRHHLHEWCLIAKELQPQRFIDPLVCTVDGKRVCLTRLLEAIPLPVEASENLLDSACRFVSLLNVLKCYDPCSGFDGVWLNNQTLLDTTWGAAKDLGILLANFMITIGLQCWVVLCTAHPFGQSAFVLYRCIEQDLMLADPCTGRRYCINDLFCPISKVDYIIAQDNIYCNIQSEARIAMMNFNINDSACWLPAFNKRNPAPIVGVQQLNYLYTQSFPCEDLHKNIERKIVKKISSWRAMRKTMWNRAFQPRLQSILLELEASSTFFNNGHENENLMYANQLAAEFPSYSLYGFTLNFSYTNLSSISERVKSTGIHLNSNKDVEFSLAVHIHPYTNNVLSIWIFLISIVPVVKAKDE